MFGIMPPIMGIMFGIIPPIIGIIPGIIPPIMGIAAELVICLSLICSSEIRQRFRCVEQKMSSIILGSNGSRGGAAAFLQFIGGLGNRSNKPPLYWMRRNFSGHFSRDINNVPYRVDPCPLKYT